MSERIVVTGMGAISPLGLSVEETWRNLVAGVSGVGPITLFDTTRSSVRFACEVKDFKPENYMEARDARRRDRFEQLAAAAAKEAIAQAGLKTENSDPGRIGVVLSSAIGGIHSTEELVRVLDRDGPRRVSPFAIPMLMANGAAGMVSIDYGLCGPSLSVASACASGIDGIGIAWMMLKAGMAEAVITGASETPIIDIALAAFDRIGALSHRFDGPILTPAPFDGQRDGLVIGEGAGVLVLETESHARRRGAVILAEIAGYASTSDAFHITAPHEDGAGGAQAMQLALQAAQVTPEQVGYISAHGTGTELNDVAETRAIKTALGEQAFHVPISSTKSMTGHMMGATGALETIFCIQAIRGSCLPPTINYRTPDPRCDLDYIPNQARRAEIQVAMNNAFGFGGHNAVLVVRKA